LAYCLGVARGWGTAALERVREWVREGKLLAARASLARDQPPLAVSPIVLRRFRVVDKAHEAKGKGEAKPIERLSDSARSGDFLGAKRMVEVELTDAFYREYVMGYELLCAWALDEALDVDPGCLYLAQRLGDTESLCTVLEVRAEEAEVGEEDEALRAPLRASDGEGGERLHNSGEALRGGGALRGARPSNQERERAGPHDLLA